MATIAVIGTGRMGAAMARRLSQSGHEIVVWNRTAATAEAVAADIGARVAGTAAEAAAGVGVVIASLADDTACLDVHTGPEGILEGVTSGTVVVDTSTIAPETVKQIAPEYERVGAHLLDGPVSGSVALVEQGTLTVMVGGDEEALNVVRPVLDDLAKAVFHLGPNGAGATMKLAVNSLVHATNLAIAEALVLAEKAGVERQRVYEVFANSAGASPFLLYKRDAFERPGATPVAFSLDLVEKDLDLILGLASRVDAPMPQLEATAQVTEEAVANGRGDQDMSALAVHLRSGS